MTPDEELEKIKREMKRSKRDYQCILIGALLTLAMVGLTYLSKV